MNGDIDTNQFSNINPNTTIPPKNNIVKNNLNSPIAIWLAFLVIVIISIDKYKKCNDRIPLTYLILGFTLVSFVIIQLVLQNYNIKINGIIVFIAAIFFLIASQLYKPNTLVKTILFSLFIIAFAFILHPLFRLADSKGVAKPALYTVCIWFVFLSVVSIYYPNIISPRIKNILFCALVFLLIFRLVLMFTKPMKNMVRFSAYIGIVLFSAFVLYDSKMMRIRANQCDHPYDFINNITALFLDFVNMWSDSMALGVTNK